MSFGFSSCHGSMPISMTVSQTNIALSHAIEDGFGLTAEEIRKIFLAKIQENKIKFSDKLFARFEKTLIEKPFKKVFDVNSMALGIEATKVISNILYTHPSFKVLLLSENSIGLEGANAIAEIILNTNSLIHVDLSANKIPNDGMSAIFVAMSKNKTIVSLDLSSKPGGNRNSIGTSASHKMSNMLKYNMILTELNVSMAEITADCATEIAKGLSYNRTLQEFNLSNNNIQSRGTLSLLPALIPTNLITLKLSANHLKDDCGPHFANFIAANKNLRNIDISLNELTNRFISSISAALSKCNSIEEINISKNPITGRGAGIMGKILASNHSLKNLIMNACKIDHNGAVSFAESFALNHGIQFLSMNNNPLRDDGVLAIGRALEFQKGLTKLSLDLVELSDSSCQQFFMSLGMSETIKSVSIKNNLIKDGIPLLRFVEQSSSIQQFSIEFNDISYKTADCIVSTLDKKNKKRQSEKKMPHDERKMTFEELEEELIDVRYTIKKQRELIDAMKVTVVTNKKETDEISAEKLKTLTQLEIRDKGMERTLRATNFTNRNVLEQLEGAVSIAKTEVEQIQNEMMRQVDKFKSDLEIMANIERKREEVNANFEKECDEINMKIKETISNYKYAIEVVKEAFREAKEGPRPPTTVIQEIEKDKSSKKKKRRSSAKTKKSSRRTPKADQGESNEYVKEENQAIQNPVLIVNARN